MNQYHVELPVFNGPLDLLLHLIERQELDITAVSLVQVTGQYLEQVRQLDEAQLEGLIDFISIGARLLLIKSRALLPRPAVLPGGDEEEEDPTEALLRQLRDYKRFKTAAQWLDSRQRHGLRTYLRVAPPPRLEGRLDLSGVDGDDGAVPQRGPAADDHYRRATAPPARAARSRAAVPVQRRTGQPPRPHRSGRDAAGPTGADQAPRGQRRAELPLRPD